MPTGLTDEQSLRRQNYQKPTPFLARVQVHVHCLANDVPAIGDLPLR